MTSPRQQVRAVLNGPCIIRTLNGSAVVEPLRRIIPRMTLSPDCTILLTYREPQT